MDETNVPKLCLKCGSANHTSSVCKGPVTSFGLIIYTWLKSDARNNSNSIKCGRMYAPVRVACPVHDNVVKYEDVNLASTKDESMENKLVFLLVERKDTVGFLNLIQGAYSDTSPYKERKVKRYLYELTCNERLMLRTAPFVDLWHIAGSNKRDIRKAEKRLARLKVNDLLEENPCQFQEADYLMPKGRLRKNETVRQCAVREFAEETGYSRNHVTLLTNMPSYEEHFVGTDGKNYRNVFFVAQMKEDAHVLVHLGTDPQQSKEVRNVGWFTFPQCKRLIRSYHNEKLGMLSDVVRRIEKGSNSGRDRIP